MKACIIGGAGFVGPYLIRHLKNDLGWDVAVTKTPHGTVLEPDCDVFDLNILEPDSVYELLESIAPDYIFHLAAQSSVSVAWENPGATIDVNIKGSVNVLDAVRKLSKKPRVLLIGSGEEYGHIRDGECPITEENAMRPGNIYAATKACQNMIGSIYADAYDMDVMMVRAFNHMGPNQTPLFVVADFCQQVALIEKGLQEPVIKVGNISAKREFTDVRDVVRAYALLIQKGKPGETYNVGSGNAVEISSILEKIISLSTVDIKVETDPDRLRPVDVPIIEADTSKLVEATGWKREIELEQTLLETLDYWRNK